MVVLNEYMITCSKPLDILILKCRLIVYILEGNVEGYGTAKAIFNTPLSLNTQAINDAYTIVTSTASTNDSQETEFVDYLDRVLEGIFRMIPLDPPVTTEFNLIKNENTGDVVALLIRNPEPFNDPKIPLDIIKGEEGSQDEDKQGTIAVMVNATNRDTNYKVLYSKDYSQALIMHSSKKITAGSFRYSIPV